MLAGAISIVTAPSLLAALGIYRAYFVEPMLIAVALVSTVRRPREAQLIVLGLCAGATVLAIANSVVVLRAILHHTFNPHASPPAAIYAEGNMIALYLVPVAAVAGSLLLFAHGVRLRLILGIFSAIAAAAVILTFSRGGWVALGVVAAGLAVALGRRWLWVCLLGAGIAATIAQLTGLDVRVGPDKTLDGRTTLWAESLRMLTNRPLTGAGLSGFMQRVAALDPSYKVQLMYPHNIVLNFWSETGLLGLGAFTVIFCVAAAISWRGWRRGALEWRPLHLGVLLALVAIFVHGLVDVPYFKNDLSLQFWILAALTVAGRAWWTQSWRPASSAIDP